MTAFEFCNTLKEIGFTSRIAISFDPYESWYEDELIFIESKERLGNIADCKVKYSYIDQDGRMLVAIVEKGE